MKVVILAAGSGTRMGAYGRDLPKGMLPVCGKSIIEWQLQKLRGIGLDDIIIVTGYKAEAIGFSGVKYYHNANYAETNMLETLMCAREAFDTDILVTYADILYTEELARKMAGCAVDIGVAADSEWREYWMARYGTTEEDLETFSVSIDGKICELGESVSSSDGIKLRYVGMIKFSHRGIKQMLDLYDKKKTLREAWIQSGKPFEKGYMTDMLHELIIAGIDIWPVVTKGGWMEFDTARDYELALNILTANESNKFFV